jgi:hypothetical protein
MTTGSLDGLGRFVIELVAQVDDEQQRGYVGADDAFVPLARAQTFTSERAAADVAGEITADHDGLLAGFVRPLR